MTIRSRSRFAAAVLAGGVIIALVMVLFLNRMGVDYGLTGRPELWARALRILNRDPRAYLVGYLGLQPATHVAWYVAHNLFLLAMMMYGAPGALAMAVLAVGCLWAGWRTFDHLRVNPVLGAMWSGMLAFFIVQTSVSLDLHEPVPRMLFAAVLAIYLGLLDEGTSDTLAGESRPQYILGVRVDPLDLPRAVATLRGWIEQRTRQYVCVANAHTLLDAWEDPSLRVVYNGSGMTTPDGMSLVWLLGLRGQGGVRRVYGPDLMLAACGASPASGWRHFFYGGEAGVAELLAARLEARFPGLAVAGTLAPPFRDLSSAEEDEIIARLNATRADIVWVGISSPKQERWMAEHRQRLSAPVLVGVGAAFDFLSGRKPQAPRWMQRAGMEWLFRLATEPRRLWRRYARYPLFVLLIVGEALGLVRSGPADEGARLADSGTR
jgi:N-acetylglucosaminyldiphosphoundecaprenol N-acetyl-beta-D-mannosaminyltransferase